MKVSIIIPAYNAEEYLPRALDSIINQVYKNLEIIVIDDASTDNTKAIIKQYAEKDNRIVPFYSSVNRGVSSARNIGLRAATGDFVLFVDSDDELTKEAIRRMIDVSNDYNSDFIDSYHLLYYRKKNGKIYSFTEKKVPKKIQVLGNLNDNIKVLDSYTYITGKLIKRSLLEGLEFNESLSRYEDLVFEHELKNRINNYVMLNKVVYLYYQRQDSLVNTLGKKHLCYLDAAKEVKKIYKNSNKLIKSKIDAMIFQNMMLTLFTKVIKNDDPIKDNVTIVTDSINKLISLIPNYRENKYINGYYKRKIDKFLINKDYLYRFIKKMQKRNFINLYFSVLSIINKYEIKNPLA